MRVNQVYRDIWDCTLTIPRHDPSFFPLTATPGWTGWCTKPKEIQEFNLFLVQPPGFSGEIAMILGHKHTAYRVLVQ